MRWAALWVVMAAGCAAPVRGPYPDKKRRPNRP
jgi:hypothetical protein